MRYQARLGRDAGRRRWARMAAGLAMVVVVLGASAPGASASIIFDNLNGGLYSGGYHSAIYAAAGCPSSQCYQVAQDFDIASDFTLTSISLPLTVPVYATTNVVGITLYSAANGLPGAPIESWLVWNQMDVGALNPALVTVQSTLRPLLSAGNTYFIGFEVPFVTPDFIYSPGSSVMERRLFAQSFDRGATWTIPGSIGLTDSHVAMRVEGDLAQTTVPEPASLLLLGTGLVGVARRFRPSR